MNTDKSDADFSANLFKKLFRLTRRYAPLLKLFDTVQRYLHLKITSEITRKLLHTT